MLVNIYIYIFLCATAVCVGHLSPSPLSHHGSSPGKVLCVLCECGLEKSSNLCSGSSKAPVNPLEQQSPAILPSFFS